MVFENRWAAWPAALLFLGAAALVGCSDRVNGFGGSPGSLDGDGGLGAGGGECAHPTAGCSCSPTQPPIDCYNDAVEVDGVITCQAGTRTCRGGVWSTCQGIRQYELRSGPGIAALVTGPTGCNPCDPACAVSRDEPSDEDLTPETSTDVAYDGTAGAIGLGNSGDAVTPELDDSDGDGVPDVADECDGAGAFTAADGSCFGDDFFYHTLPFGGPSEIDPLDIAIQVRTADVYFAMDTTGSMGGEIANLQADLTTGEFITGCAGGIIGAIRCTMPDAWFGAGFFDDYPVSPFGSATWGDQVYRNIQDITESVGDTQTAVNGLVRHNGADGPESNAQAMWAIATGGGLGPYLDERTDCAAGTWGYPCFREGAIPIVIQFTDAPYHNGPYGYDYTGFGAGAILLPTPTATAGNDDFGTAYDVGDVTSAVVGVTGDTCALTNLVTPDITCTYYSSQSGDAVFEFSVTASTDFFATIQGTTSTYPTLTLFDASTTELECQGSWYASGGDIRRTLSAGTYYLVIQNYWTYCGSFQLSFGDYSSASTSTESYPVTWTETVDALNDNGIRVITVHSGGTYGLDDANALADATSSYDSVGGRQVIPINSDGTGLSTAVVDAVVDLANYNRMDISARAADDLTTTDVDETDFLESVSAIGWGPGSCDSISGGDTFIQCVPGTTVDFSFSFRNDFVEPTATAQVFEFFIELLGDGGDFVLQQIPVRIVVPPEVAAYVPEGSYHRDYDTTTFCAATERPDWSDLNWEIVDLPTDTSIRWELRAATSADDLDSATAVTVTVPSATSPIDIGETLVTAGIPNNLPFLRVTAVLLANDSRSETPLLRSFEVTYTCRPTE